MDGKKIVTPYSWTTYLVQGWKENKKWQRRYFQSKAEAEGLLATLKVQQINNQVQLKQTFTTLSAEQIKQAEAAFRRLGDSYSLDAVIDYFIRLHYDPANPKDFKDAIEKFEAAKKREDCSRDHYGSLRAL